MIQHASSERKIPLEPGEPIVVNGRTKDKKYYLVTKRDGMCGRVPTNQIRLISQQKHQENLKKQEETNTEKRTSEKETEPNKETQSSATTGTVPPDPAPKIQSNNQSIFIQHHLL